MIRIANGQGFWGDSLHAPLEQIRRGPIDYLTLDYLAEVTMSILQKQRSRDPRFGYARDFPGFIGEAARDIVECKVKVIANAGGVNPDACRDAVRAALERGGAPKGVRIGIVKGDDILDRLHEFVDSGIELMSLDTGEPLSFILDRIQSANVYLGAWPIVDALQQGAQIVITGRCSDPALSLAAEIHEFGWGPEDWNLLAAGAVAGHTIECGAQCTGGNCQVDWKSIPDYTGIGYPILEAEADGTFVITKHANTGGRVNVAGVTEQLLYEIGDPKRFLTPDVVADFTTIQLEQVGDDRVRFSGIRGHAPTDCYKVSISYSAGYKATGELVYGWPEAYEKARTADRVLRARLDRMGLRFDSIHTQFVGASALHGEQLSGEPSPDLPEVFLRVGVRSTDQAAVDRFTKEVAPLALNGPPVVTYVGGRPKVEEVVAFWPALIPKSAVRPEVSVTED
jgi:Acyclic terpene utilisation family protein AtuA